MGLAAVPLHPYAARVHMTLEQPSSGQNQMMLMKELAMPYSRPTGEEATGKACDSACDSALGTVGEGGTGETDRGIPRGQCNSLSYQFDVCPVTVGCSGKTGWSPQGVTGTG